jgi:large subunit ribosomal protein L20
MRAMRYAQRDRRARKRDFRSLWITRVGAACRQRGVPYTRVINGLAKAKVALNRKMLAEIAVSDPGAFDRLLAIAKGQV